MSGVKALEVARKLGIASKAAKSARKPDDVLKGLGIVSSQGGTAKAASETVESALEKGTKGVTPDIGYHGTEKAGLSTEKFDPSKMTETDQFLGPGLYVSVDPAKAEEYANIRAIKFSKVLPKTDKRAVGGEATYESPSGDLFTTSSIMAGQTIDGKPLAGGQNILKLDLTNVQKTYWVKDNEDRIWALKNRDKLLEEGYDSMAFEGFGDRSRQLVVFPEHVDKVGGLKHD